MLRIKVNTADAVIVENDLITSGRRGLKCSFAFSDDWAGLAKTVIVSGAVRRDIVLVGDTIEIPGECLALPNFRLLIGVCGKNGAGDIVIPTIWCNFGKIVEGANPSGIDPDEVTPDVVAQIQSNSANALLLAQKVTRRADSGEFDGRDGSPGPIGPPGAPGAAGVSPDVEISNIPGGHTVTITDAEHPDGQSFNVMDGTSGSSDSVTPEMYGAIGDGETDDTDAVQEALDSGYPVLLAKDYKVTSVTAKNVNVTLSGSIIGQLAIENNAKVRGGTIRQSTDDACVIIRSTADEGKGYVNSSLQDCNLVPPLTGIGLELYASSNALFGFYVNNLDISSCDKSIYIYNNKWITKGAIENVFCHTPNYAIYIDNIQVANSKCADITFRNVFSQYYSDKPINFFKLATGNCIVSMYDCFSYDGVKEYHYSMTGSTGNTRINIFGQLKKDPTDANFVDSGTLRAFNFCSQYVDDSLYLKPGGKKLPAKDYLGGLYLENFNSPSLASSRFFGFIGRGGSLQGTSEPNKVFGMSCYDGRLSLLRSTDGTINNGSVVEVTTPYSGAVYTTATLPASARAGATCFCSDTMEFMTYYGGTWNRLVPAAIDRHTAELAELVPAIGSSKFTWVLGKYWNVNTGATGNADNMSRTYKFDASPGMVIQNLSPDTVTIGGNDYTATVNVHEWNGDTWLRRTLCTYGKYAVIGANTTKVSIVWGCPNQTLTLTQTDIDNNFSVRVVDAIPKTASDIGAVAVDQGVEHAGEFCVVGSDGNITTVTMTAWQGGSY